MLPTAADEGAVLGGRDIHTKDDSVTEFDFVGGFSLTWASPNFNQHIVTLLKRTHNLIRPAWSLGSEGPPQRVTSSLRPCPPAPIKVRWNLVSTVTVTVVSSPTWSAIASIAALAALMASLVPRTVTLVTAPLSSTRSTSIWAPVLSLISLIDAPPLPRIRATERLGTVNLRMLLVSFSNSRAYECDVSA